MDSSKKKDEKIMKYPFLAPLMAGALAGLSVDVVLYPLDTLKTRLQSAQGFRQAGGFKNVYRGLLTVASTSMPTSALFFTSYEATKRLAQPLVPAQYAPLVHMTAAGIGEVFACIIRVPTEIAKQRKQTVEGLAKRSSTSILLEAYKSEGLSRGVYRGFLSTVLRDLPFSFIELPLWELLKTLVKRSNDGHISSFQSGLCGALAGGAAAALTTPLDLVKTRVMLARRSHAKLCPVLTGIYAETGFRGLFAGVTPRTTAFMIGGFVFFSVYDDITAMVETRLAS